MSLMLKHSSARATLLLFVRTRRHLEYYLNLSDTLCAANQNGILSSCHSSANANVIEIHPIGRVQLQYRH